jgi:hypothetical protein
MSGRLCKRVDPLLCPKHGEVFAAEVMLVVNAVEVVASSFEGFGFSDFMGVVDGADVSLETVDIVSNVAAGIFAAGSVVSVSDVTRALVSSYVDQRRRLAAVAAEVGVRRVPVSGVRSEQVAFVSALGVSPFGVDDSQFEVGFVFCAQHGRVHSTGWCSAQNFVKVPLRAVSPVAATVEATRLGFVVSS